MGSVIRHTNDCVDVLIVEDSPTQALQLQRILEQQGYEVRHAANGRLALDTAKERRPALVISDVVMPEMDGYELCRRLKGDASLSDVPVILVTTLSDPGDVIRGLECGADNFILKPYDEHYLVSRVRCDAPRPEHARVGRTGYPACDPRRRSGVSGDSHDRRRHRGICD